MTRATSISLGTAWYETTALSPSSDTSTHSRARLPTKRAPMPRAVRTSSLPDEGGDRTPVLAAAPLEGWIRKVVLDPAFLE